MGREKFNDVVNRYVSIDSCQNKEHEKQVVFVIQGPYGNYNIQLGIFEFVVTSRTSLGEF